MQLIAHGVSLLAHRSGEKNSETVSNFLELPRCVSPTFFSCPPTGFVLQPHSPRAPLMRVAALPMKLWGGASHVLVSSWCLLSGPAFCSGLWLFNNICTDCTG